MLDPRRVEAGQTRNSMLPLWAALAAALLLAVGALIWSFSLNTRLQTAELKLGMSEQKDAEMAQRQEAMNARLRATTETLGQSMGVTQKQIEDKTQALIVAQAQAARAASAQTARLAREQKETAQQVGAVQSTVSAVQSDVTGAKASIADTQTDLQQTKANLQRTIGDAGVMSGLIARNHDELEELKHRGDRTYYEFTLQKGGQATTLGSIRVQAKKVDLKKSRYTMLVNADDRNIEKKDKSLDEPVQFYSGKDPLLYEIVVNNMQKNQISGYLSTPKNAGGGSGGGLAAR